MDTIEARTVFISSRMDELAIERRSAYAAVYEAGFTPILFEMEPQEDERAKIDALVDRADLFLGIYYSTIGTPNDKQLLNFCPIEYELLRFLVRFRICKKPESWQLTNADLNAISAKMEDSDYLKKLQKEMRYQCARKAGEIYDIFRDRIRLFLRKHDPDNWASRKLLEFLESLPKISFGNERIDAPETAALFRNKKRYVPSHLSLFDRVYRQLCEAQERDRVKIVPPGDGGFMRFDIEGEDEPGLLYQILNVCFDHFLNIKSLILQKSESADPLKEYVLISLVSESYYAHPSYQLTERDWSSVERALGHSLGERRIERTAAAFWAETPGGIRKIPRLDYFCEVYTFDVPGIIMTVARLVSHLGGNIKFIYFGKTGVPVNSRYFSLVIGVVPLPNTPIYSERGRKGFEYELESVMGVASIFTPSWEVLCERFNGDASSLEVEAADGGDDRGAPVPRDTSTQRTWRG